ncbi:MAG: hypothetical protein AB2A00_18555 [Myxococcota bacterium]
MTAVDGDYSEVLRNEGTDADGDFRGSCHHYWGIVDRPGTYTISVDHEGFATQFIEDVNVRRLNECEIKGGTRTALLEPLQATSDGGAQGDARTVGYDAGERP